LPHGRLSRLRDTPGGVVAAQERARCRSRLRGYGGRGDDEKIWGNSGDSHLVGPDDLFATTPPPELARRMARRLQSDDGRMETVYVDGQSFGRRIPRSVTSLTDIDGNTLDNERAPGANDVNLRLHDLDQEGVWAELVYPSIGIWMSSIRDPALLAAG